ncbi:MAG: type II toxin-antitoxin system death-on-curing family toxin [Candidatus Krumholzibacteriota bacterium]|nr:type II toxin-antitoxin system death-on-curing family toxin [Candidatus Krumholzibacteriota bacterium]
MQPVAYLSVEIVLEIHRRVIEEFGGDPGLRDRGMLESAVSLPQSTFDGKDLHTGLSEKAAAYHFHLCANHPFVDGNKRVAVTAAELFLLINGRELPASDEEVEDLTLGVAGGRLSKEHVIEFFVRFVK